MAQTRTPSEIQRETPTKSRLIAPIWRTLAAGIALVMLAQASPASAFVPKILYIDRYAGTGVDRSTGDGGPARTASLSSPFELASDSVGNVYVAESGRVRRIDAATNIVMTVAGTGTVGSSGDGGPATAARLSPDAIALDAGGDLFIADWNANVIRRVDARTGTITTIAGNGGTGPGGMGDGDGAAASRASVAHPADLAVDSTGNIFLVQQGSLTNTVRRIDAVTGIITTVPLPLYKGGASLAIDSADRLYYISGYSVQRFDPATGDNDAITGSRFTYHGESGDGGLAVNAGIAPDEIAIDRQADYLYVSSIGKLVRGIDLSTGIIVAVAGTGAAGESGDGYEAKTADIVVQSMTVDRGGRLFTSNQFKHTVRIIACGAVGGYGLSVADCLR